VPLPEAPGKIVSEFTAACVVPSKQPNIPQTSNIRAKKAKGA